MYFSLFILIFMLILVILYNAHIKLNITYKRIENNDFVIIIMSASYGIIKYRIELPFLDFVKKVDSFGLRYRMRLNYGREIPHKLRLKRAESIRELLDNLDDLIGTYYINKKTIKYIIKKIDIRDLSISINIGFNDAFITGVSCGIIYLSIVNFLALLKSRISLEIENIELKPVFNKDIFDIILSCIIDIKLGHIITGIKMFIKTSRGSEIDGTTYSGSYENNYGKY